MSVSRRCCFTSSGMSSGVVLGSVGSFFLAVGKGAHALEAGRTDEVKQLGEIFLRFTGGKPTMSVVRSAMPGTCWRNWRMSS